MSGPLTRTDRQLRKRFRALGQKLNNELGFRDQRLVFLTRQDPRGIVAWVLRSQQSPPTSSWREAACQIAESTRQASAVHLAYSERWAHGGRRVGFWYESSNMRFVIVSGQTHAELLNFRLEWAAQCKDTSGQLTFPGRGAAHPHWHIDLHKVDSNEGRKDSTILDISLTDPVEDVDLRTRIPETPKPLHWFHKLHLPARATWHKTPCHMPHDVAGHQHEPENVDEIDNWILSAIRYVRHEFETYS